MVVVPTVIFTSSVHILSAGNMLAPDRDKRLELAMSARELGKYKGCKTPIARVSEMGKWKGCRNGRTAFSCGQKSKCRCNGDR
jgi:hypothetical protein